MAQTLWEVLERTARARAERPAMQVKRSGEWCTTSWREYREQAMQAARGFIKLGLEPGQGVTIMSFNRPEWFLADMGAIAAGGIPTGIYTTSTPEQCRYIAEHAEAAVVVVENSKYLETFLSMRDRLPRLKAIVVMTDNSGGGDAIYCWHRFLALGGSVPEEEVHRRLRRQSPQDHCTLIYTSGTTGPPKGVMLSHHNLVWTARSVADAFELRPDTDFFSYLPLSHILEQLVSLHIPMAVGACSWFAESMEKLRGNLREVRPQVFVGVPRVWEKIRAAIQTAGAHSTGLKRQIVVQARRIGLQAGYAEQRGERRPHLYGLAHKLVFSKVRERIGLDRAQFCITGAAPISLDTLEFFLSLGIPILEGYGMSENTGPATLSTPRCYRTGKAGRPLPGTELKIAKDGEILMRGPHVFLGYAKDEVATREALDAEGWLHSGDLGVLDAEGFLQVTDRKKELIVTSGGDNISPQLLESKLKQIPVVAQAVVVGDRRAYVAALLTLDPDRVALEAEVAGSLVRELEAAATCPIFNKHLKKQIDEVNRTLARHETIRRFTILPREFTIEADELTPTMKLKRRVIYMKYAEEIQRLYA